MRVWGAGLAAVLLGACAVVGSENGRHQADEQQIRAMYDRLSTALRARDVKAMMDNYEPNVHLFIVDLMSDGRSLSREEYSRHWELWLAGLPLETQATTAPAADSLRIEDRVVETDGTLAYTHARLASLLILDGLRKIDGK